MKNFIHSLKKNRFPKIVFRTIISTGLIVPFFVLGDIPIPAGYSTDKDLGPIFAQVLSALVAVGIPIAGLYVVYAGYLFVSSTGEPKQLDAAKSALFNAVIGTALIVGASIIVETVRSTVSGLN